MHIGMTCISFPYSGPSRPPVRLSSDDSPGWIGSWSRCGWGSYGSGCRSFVFDGTTADAPRIFLSSSPTISVPASVDGGGEHGAFSSKGVAVFMSSLWLMFLCMQRQAYPQEDPSMDWHSQSSTPALLNNPCGVFMVVSGIVQCSLWPCIHLTSTPVRASTVAWRWTTTA